MCSKPADRRLVIDLSEHDAYRLLTLVQNQAATGQIWNDYWERLANEINNCLTRQQSGEFFQCSACAAC